MDQRKETEETERSEECEEPSEETTKTNTMHACFRYSADGGRGNGGDGVLGDDIGLPFA